MSALVTGKLELTGTLASIARVVVDELADYCTVDLIEDGVVQRREAVSRDPGDDRVREVLLRGSLDQSAVGSQNGAVLQKVTPEVISSWAAGADDRSVLDSARFKSVIVVPLRAYGKMLGALSLFSSSTYEPEDLRLVDVIAERAALLIHSSLLYLSATRAAQARDNVLAVVAHDIRNPLTAVAALAAVLKKGSEYEIGQEIADAASDMKRLIDDLVEVTRIEAGRLSLNPERLPVAQIISDVLQRQRALTSAKGIELRVDPLPALPDIWADRDRVLQVFANLIGNAIKFTNEGGCITVRAAGHENGVLFSVSDTGCGIASHDVPHVFDRFWQASDHSQGGLGFGLAIVKGIVEDQGGCVWVESVVGKGSTFSFTVPRAQPQPTASVLPEPVEAD
jgi:signal transduction histidine kinase